MVYQMEHPDYGMMVYPDIDCLLDEIRHEIESHDLDPTPSEITIKIRLVEMTQEEIDALPTTDDL